jgi:hypothetical protein
MAAAIPFSYFANRSGVEKGKGKKWGAIEFINRVLKRK